MRIALVVFVSFLAYANTFSAGFHFDDAHHNGAHPGSDPTPFRSRIRMKRGAALRVRTRRPSG